MSTEKVTPTTFTPAEERLRRLMVEFSYLIDLASTYFEQYLDKTTQAFEAPTTKDAEALHVSAMKDVMAAMPLYPVMFRAILGQESAIDEVHNLFNQFAQGKPN